MRVAIEVGDLMLGGDLDLNLQTFAAKPGLPGNGGFREVEWSTAVARSDRGRQCEETPIAADFRFELVQEDNPHKDRGIGRDAGNAELEYLRSRFHQVCRHLSFSDRLDIGSPRFLFLLYDTYDLIIVADTTSEGNDRGAVIQWERVRRLGNRVFGGVSEDLC